MNHTFLSAFTFLIALSCIPTAIATTPASTDSALDSATGYAWELGLQSLINAEQASRTFSAQVDQFLTEPSEAGLLQMRQDWHASHRQWLQHSVWVTLANSQNSAFDALNRRYFSIDARDLQPGYLDAVEDYPLSGIVNDISIVLTAESLRQQHGLTDTSEVALGFHALELLLWGEKGQRSFNDFLPITVINAEQNTAGLTTSDLPNNRRRTLLRLVNQLLNDDIQRLRQDWQNPHSHISQSYLSLPPATRLAYMEQTARHLLAVELPDQLLQAMSPDKYTHHNQFAGDTHHHTAALLAGLETLLTSGEKPLLNWLVDAERNLEWQQQLRTQLATLAEPDDMGRITAVQQQLPQLATALKGVLVSAATD